MEDGGHMGNWWKAEGSYDCKVLHSSSFSKIKCLLSLFHVVKYLFKCSKIMNLWPCWYCYPLYDLPLLNPCFETIYFLNQFLIQATLNLHGGYALGILPKAKIVYSPSTLGSNWIQWWMGLLKSHSTSFWFVFFCSVCKAEREQVKCA